MPAYLEARFEITSMWCYQLNFLISHTLGYLNSGTSSRLTPFNIYPISGLLTLLWEIIRYLHFERFNFMWQLENHWDTLSRFSCNATSFWYQISLCWRIWSAKSYIKHQFFWWHQLSCWCTLGLLVPKLSPRKHLRQLLLVLRSGHQLQPVAFYFWGNFQANIAQKDPNLVVQHI